MKNANARRARSIDRFAIDASSMPPRAALRLRLACIYVKREAQSREAARFAQRITGCTHRVKRVRTSCVSRYGEAQ